MKRLLIPVTLGWFLLLVPGCSFVYYPQTGSRIYDKTNPAEITVYSTEPEQDYEVLGSVAAEVPGDGEDAVRFLKKKAASFGADAIIHVDIYLNEFESENTGISGVAVKLKES